MIELPDFRAYLTMEKDQLLSSLATVSSEICGLTQEVAIAEQTEIERRVDGWLKSQETTIKGREWAAITNAAGAKTTAIERHADLAVKTEEKWFILRLLGDGTLQHS